MLYNIIIGINRKSIEMILNEKTVKSLIINYYVMSMKLNNLDILSNVNYKIISSYNLLRFLNIHEILISLVKSCKIPRFVLCYRLAKEL